MAEIIGQVWLANAALKESANTVDVAGKQHPEPERPTARAVTNVVMMGMGEPLANFENVVTALDLMLDDHAYGLSRRRVTVSTKGLIPALDRLRERCPVALGGIFARAQRRTARPAGADQREIPAQRTDGRLPPLSYGGAKRFHHV